MIAESDSYIVLKSHLALSVELLWVNRHHEKHELSESRYHSAREIGFVTWGCI